MGVLKGSMPEGGGFHPPLFLAVIVAMIIKLGNEMDFHANNQNYVIESNKIYCLCCYDNKKKLNYDYYDHHYHD